MFKLESSIDNNKYDLDRFMNPVKSTERSKALYFDVIDSEFLFQLQKLSNFGTYKILDEEGRPDLLSERIFGTGKIQYWWILMLLNGLRLPSDLKRGMTIKYPSMYDLEAIYINLLPNISNGRESRSSIMAKEDRPLVRKEILYES